MENRINILTGGWTGNVQNNEIFIKIEANGMINVVGNNFNRDPTLKIINLDDKKVELVPILPGRRVYSFPKQSNLSDEEKQKLVIDIDKFIIGYKVDSNILEILLEDGENFIFKKCVDLNCNDFKPDNIRLSNWCFNLEVIKIDSDDWVEYDEDISKFVTIAKTVNAFNENSNNELLEFCKSYPHLSLNVPKFGDPIFANNEINIVTDRKEILKNVGLKFKSYLIEFPESEFYIIGINADNKVVRKQVNSKMLLQSELSIENWSIRY